MSDKSEDVARFEPGEFEWIESSAIENLKARIATADTLAKEAANTLTVLLAGAGGAYAYAIKLLDEKATLSSVAALAAAGWLTLLAMLLVWSCLRIKAIPVIYNQPENLLQRPESKLSLEEFKLNELRDIGRRIIRARDRNNEIARHLNNVRLLATFTPILALAILWLYTR
jgi:hypothetical protein